MINRRILAREIWPGYMLGMIYVQNSPLSIAYNDRTLRAY